MTHWIIGQAAKTAVTEFLIKWERLKIECVAMRMDATASQGFIFCDSHQTATNSALSMVFSNPKLLDKQPAPMGISDKATNNDTVATRKYDEVTIIF